MLNPKRLLKYFGIFWAVFIALQLLFSVTGVRIGLASIHADVYANVTQMFLTDVKLSATERSGGNEILFKFYSEKQAREMVKEAQRAGGGRSVSVPEYEYGIDPSYHLNMALSFIIAIFLATPLAWKKRFILAGIGTVLFYIYSFIRVTIKLKYEISQLNIGLYESDPSSFLSLHKLNNLFSSLGLIFMVIILIWAFLIFTKKNIAQLKLNLM